MEQQQQRGSRTLDMSVMGRMPQIQEQSQEEAESTTGSNLKEARGKSSLRKIEGLLRPFFDGSFLSFSFLFLLFPPLLPFIKRFQTNGSVGDCHRKRALVYRETNFTPAALFIYYRYNLLFSGSTSSSSKSLYPSVVLNWGSVVAEKCCLPRLWTSDN